jgi:lipoprotein-anchoring transpeptidase ErfK/SrfK
VRRHVDADPQDAKVDFSASGLSKVTGHDGFQLDKAILRTRVQAALLKPGATQRTVAPPIHRIHPQVTTDDLAKKYSTAIIVNRNTHTLSLYKDLKLSKTYPIAVGMQGLETPAGLYDIENKQVNPYWHVPNSSWAGSLAGHVIPPGPENPIKARWMGIIGGAGIHGTTDDASIGSNASHGCIRMHIPDVIDLYDRVPVGAAVYII